MELLVNVICGTVALSVLAGAIALIIDISSERILKWKRREKK